MAWPAAVAMNPSWSGSHPPTEHRPEDRGEDWTTPEDDVRLVPLLKRSSADVVHGADPRRVDTGIEAVECHRPGESEPSMEGRHRDPRFVEEKRPDDLLALVPREIDRVPSAALDTEARASGEHAESR
jgi:hypothetical protein